jgi:DnaJ-class molecular chaperone
MDQEARDFEVCFACGGNGFADVNYLVLCKECDGSGLIDTRTLTTEQEGANNET